MKKKLLAILMITAIMLSLNSCYLLDYMIDGTTSGTQQGTGGTGDTVINVNGGDSYEITINVEGNKVNEVAASRALLSSVSVLSAFTSGYGASASDYYSQGSGVIYSIDKDKGDAYIITNYHVVYDSNANTTNGISSEIYIYLYGMELYPIAATYVGGSMNYDIALLKVEASTTVMKSIATAATFADSNDVSVLQSVMAIGNAAGEGISASLGCVSVESEDIYVSIDSSSTVSLRVIRTDAAVNSGNSGGGLFNMNGELLGIVNAKIADDSIENIGYAIPSNIVKYIAENILYYGDGHVYKCLLNVMVAAVDMYVEYDVESGLLHRREVVAVYYEEGSDVPASSLVYGHLHNGDIINSITVDGTTYEVSRVYHLIDIMINARVGSSVTINYTHNGAVYDVTIEIPESALTLYE